MSLLSVVAGSLALLLWTAFQIGGPRTSSVVADVANIVGPALTFTLLPTAWRRRRSPTFARVALCFYAAVLLWCLGCAYWLYEDVFLERVRYPSWADGAWLVAYLFLFAGVLLLPRRASTAEERVRALLDGLMVAIVAAAFSWYLELGPTLLRGEASAITASVNAAYPLADLILAVCLLIFTARITPDIRPTARALAVALSTIVFADSVYLYKVLDGTYISGTPLDVTWFFAYGIVGISARNLLTSDAGSEGPPDRTSAAVASTPLQTFAPYALIPALGVLVAWAWHDGADAALQQGVYLAAGLLLVVILLRQVVVILQNQALVRALSLARAEIATALDETHAASRRFELAAEATRDVVWDLDVASGTIWWNSGPARLFGYTGAQPAGGLDWWEECLHPEDRARVNRAFDGALEGDTSWMCMEYRFRRADGSYAFVLDRFSIMRDGAGRAMRVVGAMLDTTEHRKAERSLLEMNQRLRAALHEVSERERVIAAQAEQLRASQEKLVSQERLRALGTMAAGIAHDLNNALAPVAGFAELLTSVPGALEDRGRARTYLDLIHTGAQDAAGVVRRLREFYRPRESGDAFAPVALDALVRETIALTQPTWKNQALTRGVVIAVEANLPPLPPVLGDAAALREALTNLIINAVDAMPEGGAVGLALSLDGEAAVLTVSDTGIGMTEDVRQRCLEPFFTTKGERGSGLGLAMVHGIVQRHNATMRVESQPGEGTRFALRLPLARAESLATPSLPCPMPADSERHPLRVLVVDDEPPVRATVAALLEAEGHTVRLADGAVAALEALALDAADVVVTDRAMPGVPGDQLALRVRELYPAIPVVLVSGYGDLMNASGERPEAVAAVLGKPVRREDLRHTLALVTG